MARVSVHQSPVTIAAEARSVIAFWFEEAGPTRWFAKDAEFDAEITQRFGALREEVVATGATGWRDDVVQILAAILLTDQFSRNMFRGTARAFEADPLALDLARHALARDWTHIAPRPWRQFLLMPLMHSERLADQQRSVTELARLGDPELTPFAVKHHDQIELFGRFPGRNAALGRESTDEEQEVIERGEVF